MLLCSLSMTRITAAALTEMNPSLARTAWSHSASIGSPQTKAKG